jgi:hypothetical protein
LLFFGIST